MDMELKRKSKWLLEGKYLKPSCVSKFSFDLEEKTLCIVAFDFPEWDENSIYTFLDNVYDETLTFKCFDGCNQILSHEMFSNINITNIEFEYDYADSSVSLVKIKTKFENYNKVKINKPHTEPDDEPIFCEDCGERLPETSRCPCLDEGNSEPGKLPAAVNNTLYICTLHLKGKETHSFDKLGSQLTIPSCIDITWPAKEDCTVIRYELFLKAENSEDKTLIASGALNMPLRKEDELKIEIKLLVQKKPPYLD